MASNSYSIQVNLQIKILCVDAIAVHTARFISGVYRIGHIILHMGIKVVFNLGLLKTSI